MKTFKDFKKQLNEASYSGPEYNSKNEGKNNGT